MEELLEILNEIDDSIDYENETALIDDQLLDSFAIITLVSELEDAFAISIEASEMMIFLFSNHKCKFCRNNDLSVNGCHSFSYAYRSFSFNNLCL